MQTVKLQIKNKKAYNLLKNLEKINLIKLLKEPEPTPYKRKIAKSIKNAMKEVKEFDRGKLKLRNAKDLLDEL
jgi:16S rRNA C1402 N4-methylase RsmH